MNPTATLRLRRLTAAFAVTWALLAIALALFPIVFPRDYLTLPFQHTGVAGTVIVQSTCPEARAAGVEPGDRLLTIDGASFYHWFLDPNAVLHADRSNLYEFERNGQIYSVSLMPKVDSIATIPALWAGLYAGLLLVSVIYLAIGFVVWRLRPDRAEAWALLLFCSAMSAQLSLSFDWVPTPLTGPRLLINIPFIGATVFHLFTTYPVEPAWVVRRRGLRPLMYAVAFTLASLSLVGERLGLPPSLFPQLAFYFTIATSLACFASMGRERRR
ncbi:MAG TPA: hypothetical protein VEG67_01280, partial [Myxococcota bacterium]|nr:hypothetical protein [Myxococcota bacterium]